jgi:hypothetical protein
MVSRYCFSSSRDEGGKMTDRSLEADGQNHSAGEVGKELKGTNRTGRDEVGFDFTPVRGLEPDASPARSIRHVEEGGGIVADLFIPAVWMDFVQQNGKDTGEVRIINTETGERSYQIIVKGCIYIGCMEKGRESLYRVASDYSSVDFIERGSAEFRRFHKKLSKIDFDGLPLSESLKQALTEPVVDSPKVADLLDHDAALKRMSAGSSSDEFILPP